MVTSPLGFEARVDHSLACLIAWFLRFTSGANPADLLAVSIQDRTCGYIIGCDKTDALPTELCRLGLVHLNWPLIRYSHLSLCTDFTINLLPSATCLSFCSRGGGGACLPQCMLGYTPRADTPRQTPPRADTPRTDTPLADGYCCGRYASYWNTFLLIICALYAAVESHNVRTNNSWFLIIFTFGTQKTSDEQFVIHLLL